MRDYRLVVQMKGPTTDDGDVRFEDFLSFLRDLLSTLNATDRAVAHADEPTTDYRIHDLSRKSPATVVLLADTREAAVDLRDRVLTTFVGGIKGIVSGSGVPVGFNTELLLNYQELAKHLNGRRLREASFSHRKLKAKVATSFQQKIEQLVGPDQTEHGAISGMLDIVNAHQARPFFWLYPAGGQERVRCFFSSALTSKIGGAIRRYVTVTGTLRFKAKMLRPHAVSVSDIDIHEPDIELPSLRSLRGIVSTPADTEPAEQSVRRLRDAW